MAESSQVLKKLDFPAYCIKHLENGLVAIAGGGGTSKTGVGNSIELGIIEYDATNSSNISSNNKAKQHDDDGIARFKSIHTFVPNDAIMKFVSFSCERTLHHSAAAASKSANKANNGTLVASKKADAASTSSNISNTSSTGSPLHVANDLYLAAIVNNTIEVYKLLPVIRTKTSTTDHHPIVTADSSKQQQQQQSTSASNVKNRMNAKLNEPDQAEVANHCFFVF